MVPVSQIISKVRTRHESESSVRWIDADILDSVNDGLEDLSEETQFFERYVSIPIVSRRSYYDLRGWLPEEALGVTSAWSSLNEDWLTPVSVPDLKSRWEQSVGPPLSFALRGIFWMVVWPKPETTVGYHRVYFSSTAPPFTHPQAVLRDLTNEHITALEDYALYDMAAQDAETERALVHWQDYFARMKRLRDHVDRRIVKARTLVMGVR